MCSHDVQFSCAINQPLLAHHWRVHHVCSCHASSHLQSPGEWVPLVTRWGSSFLRTITFLIIHRFLSLKVVLLLYLLFKKHYIQFEKLFWIWWKVLDTTILWQDVGPCCEQTHAAFEVGLSLDQGQGFYTCWSDVDGRSQLRLCHRCIIDLV